MKLSQLDYSGIQNANIAKLNANQNKKNNEALTMQNKVNKANQQALERSIALNKKFEKVRNDSNAASRFSSIVNSSLNIVNSSLNLGSSIYNAKVQADQSRGNLMLLENIAAVNDYVMDPNNKLGSFNDEGKYTISDEFKSFLEDKVKAIQSSDLAKPVKDSIVEAYSRSAYSTSSSIAEREIANWRNAEAQSEARTINEYSKVDIINSKGRDSDGNLSYSVDAGYSYIDSLVRSGKYNEAQGKAQKQAYGSLVQSEVRKNSYFNASANGNLAEAYSMIDTDLKNKEITDEEAFNYKNTVSKTYNETKTQNIQLTSNLANAGFSEEHKAPKPLWNEIASVMNYDAMDQEMKDAVKSAFQVQQQAEILRQYPTLSNINNANSTELSELKVKIGGDKQGLFWDMEESKNNILSLIDERFYNIDLSATQSIRDSANSKRTVELSSFQNNEITRDGLLDRLNAINDWQEKETDSYWKNRIKEYEKAEENEFGTTFLAQTRNEGLFNGERTFLGYDSPIYEYKNASSLVNWNDHSVAVNNAVISKIPDELKEPVDSLIKSALSSAFSEKQFSKLSLDDQIKWIQMEDAFKFEVLDLCQSGNVSLTQVIDRINEVKEKYVKGVPALLLDIANGDKTLVTTGVINEEVSKNQETLVKKLADRPDLLVDNPNNEVGRNISKVGYSSSMFRDESVAYVYSELGNYLQDSMEDKGIIPPGVTNGLILTPQKNENGELIAVPQIQYQGKTYKAVGSDLYVLENGKWNKFKKVEAEDEWSENFRSWYDRGISQGFAEYQLKTLIQSAVINGYFTWDEVPSQFKKK